MGYWKLTTDCLYQLKKNWTTFYYDRLDALEELIIKAEEDYRNEANRDLKEDRYTARSIQEWYDDKVYKAKKWYEESIKTLQAEHEKFVELYYRATNDTFDSNDFGYVIIYDFYKFERRKEICREIDNKTFRVRFSGKKHWYSLAGRRKDLSFDTTKPYFDKFE